MIRMRKECPEVGWGSCEVLSSRIPSVLALRYDWKGNSVVTIHNFGSKPVEVSLRLNGPRSNRLVNVIEPDESRANGRGTHKLIVEAHGYRWYRVGDLNYALMRERTPVEEK